MATGVSLSLRNSIQDLQANPENRALRQKYCDGLSSLHEEVFHEPTKLFKKYFYLQCAHDLTRGGFTKYPGPRLRLLPSAATVVKTEKASQDAVLRDDGSSLEAFPLFMEKYTAFAHQLFEELREIYSLSPFFFKDRYAITVCWFQSIVEMLAKERVGFSELFETRDPSALSMIFRIGILRWIAKPEGEVPEIFREQNDLETMREQYFALSPHAQERLKNVLIGIEEIDDQNPEFALFIAIGKLKAELESNASLCNSLLHTLALQNA